MTVAVNQHKPMVEKVIPRSKKNVGAAKRKRNVCQAASNCWQSQIAEHKLKRDVDVRFKMKKREYQQ